MQMSVMAISAADQTMRPTLSSIGGGLEWLVRVAVGGSVTRRKQHTEVIRCVEAFDFSGTDDAGGGGAARGQLMFL